MTTSDQDRTMSPCLELHGVNVDPICDRLLALATRAGIQGTKLVVSPDDRDDYLQELRLSAWQLADRYRPADSGSSFEQWLTQRLRWRLIDLVREREGRTRWTWGDGSSYEREPTVVLSLDAEPADGGDRLGDAQRGRAPDPADDRSPTLARALLPRDRRTNRTHPPTGQRRPRHTRRGDQDPGVGREAA